MKQSSGEVPNLDFKFEDNSIVKPCFGILLFTDALFSKHADAILEAYKGFERLCPRSQLTYYRTETMSKRKPVTPGTFNLLQTWLKPNAPKREYIAFDINAGLNWIETSDINFSVMGRELDAPTYEFGDANWIWITTPLSRIYKDLEDLQYEAKRLFESLPYVSGQAGPMLELSIYNREMSQRFAWKSVMRYRGFDFCDHFADSEAVKNNGVRGINWLTFLGSRIVGELGGVETIRSKISSNVELFEFQTGICLKAGKLPKFGDKYRNERLVDYESVFWVCEPAIHRMNERYSPMMLSDDDDEECREKTTRAMRRLAYEDF